MSASPRRHSDVELMLAAFLETLSGEIAEGAGGITASSAIPLRNGKTALAAFSADASGGLTTRVVAIVGADVKADDLRDVSIVELKEKARVEVNDSAVPPAKPLTRDGQDPESFWRLFAEWYLWAARESTNPAAHLADFTGTKPSTIHSWTREARLRHFLPPARGYRSKWTVKPDLDELK